VFASGELRAVEPSLSEVRGGEDEQIAGGHEEGKGTEAGKEEGRKANFRVQNFRGGGTRCVVLKAARP
jgi:hypothetical protein